jgi:hypothetical protein
MVHDNLPAGVIITKGLGGDYRSWILAQFHLFIGVGSPPLIEISVRVVGGRSGVVARPPVPYYPRPRDDDELWKPRDDLEKEVIITVRIGDREVERHYFRKNADRAIEAIKLLNTTKDRISVTADKIKDTTQKAIVSLKNLKKKD